MISCDLAVHSTRTIATAFARIKMKISACQKFNNWQGSQHLSSSRTSGVEVKFRLVAPEQTIWATAIKQWHMESLPESVGQVSEGGPHCAKRVQWQRLLLLFPPLMYTGVWVTHNWARDQYRSGPIYTIPKYIIVDFITHYKSMPKSR